MIYDVIVMLIVLILFAPIIGFVSFYMARFLKYLLSLIDKM